MPSCSEAKAGLSTPKLLQHQLRGNHMFTNQNNSQIIIYKNESGEVKLDVRFDGDTVWLTQKLMAELFDVTVANMHLKKRCQVTFY